jgi:DNA-binding ferritin-like protein
MTLTLFILVVLANQVIVSLLGGLMVDIIGEGMKAFREQEKKRIIGDKLDDVIEKLDRISGIHANDDKISGTEYDKLLELMDQYDEKWRDNSAGYSEGDEFTTNVTLKRTSSFLKEKFESYFASADSVTERNRSLTGEEKMKLAGRMEDLLEHLDVDLEDLKSIKGILFPTENAEDHISAKEFKNYFSAWCFKLQKPTTYRDIVHLQKCIDALQQNQENIMMNQENMMKRVVQQGDELKQSMLLELQRSFEQLRVDLAVDAGTKLKGRPHR